MGIDPKAQGALEYLLLIGGVVLIATIVLLMLLSSSIPYANSIVQNVIGSGQQQIWNGSGLNTTPTSLVNGPFSIGNGTDYLLFDYNSTPAQNLQLTQLVSPIQSFNLPIDSLWKGEFQNSSSKVKSLVDSSSVAVPVSMVSGNPAQLVWDNVEVEPNSNAFAQVRLLIYRSGPNFEFKTRVQLPPGYDLVSIHFPEFHLLPQGSGVDDYFIVGWQGGQRIENPYVDITIPTSTSSPGPNPLGMFALYDEPSRTGLYWSLQDGVGYTKDIRIAGSGTDFEWETTHYVPIPTSSTYETPYPLLLSAFAGNWFDAAQKYRAWALSQSMASRGKWEFSPLVSSQARTARALMLLASPQSNSDYTSYHAEIDSAVNFLGTDNLLVHWYSWHQHPFDNDWPDHLEKPTFQPAVAQAHATHPNLGVIPYYFAGSWDVDLGSSSNISYPTPPNDTNYPYTPAIAAMACKQENGTTILHGPGTLGWTFAPLDPSFSAARVLESQVVLDLIANNGIDGIYLDAYSGASPEICFNDPALSGHPKYGGNYWTQGKLGLLKEVSAYAKSLSPGFVLTSENLDEFLTPGLDVQSHYPFSFYNVGLPGFIPVPLYSAVYHDYIPLTTISGFGPTHATADPLGQNYTRMFMAARYHMGLLISYENWQLGNLTLFSNASPDLEPMHVFGQELVKSYSFTSPYVLQGQMARPLAGSLFDTLSVDPSLFTVPFSSVWYASTTNKVGIILTNPTSGVESFNQSIDLLPYGFAAGTTVTITKTSTRASGATPATQSQFLTQTSSGQAVLSFSLEPYEVVLLELSI